MQAHLERDLGREQNRDATMRRRGGVAGVGVAVICPISFDLNLPIASQALRGSMSAFE